jgi:hypothetical protein
VVVVSSLNPVVVVVTTDPVVVVSTTDPVVVVSSLDPVVVVSTTDPAVLASKSTPGIVSPVSVVSESGTKNKKSNSLFFSMENLYLRMLEIKRTLSTVISIVKSRIRPFIIICNPLKAAFFNASFNADFKVLSPPI